PQKVPACAERWRRQPRTSQISTEESIKRTVYVSDIDQQVTEEQLATLFLSCGQVIDCRICGDPNSILRFAFVEFTNEEGAKKALTVAGTMLGYYPLRVLPSKTAILPVNPDYLPKSQGEKEMCARTIYCTNIDKKVAHSDVKLFFESLCGEVSRLRLLGDSQHSTRIAFVEFVMAESAMAALNCSGAILGSLPIRVSPSKTPLRPKGPRHHLLLDGQPRKYHHTGLVTNVNAMREALAMLAEEGLENVWQRHRSQAELLWAGLQELGLDLFVEDHDSRLPTVTTVKVPEGVEWTKVTGHLMSKFNLEIAGGLGPTVGKVWRIGLMGNNARPANVALLLEALKDALEHAGFTPKKATA
ncbi:unnamed protein product, partial [Closterium sp. NIES-53]